MTEQKGDELMAQAEKRLGAIAFFNPGKWDDAVDLFEKASAQYKMAKSWEKAGDSLIRAAEVAETKDSEVSAADFYKQAAGMYKKVSPEEAARVYQMLATKHMQNNNFSTAAKMYKTVAELFEEDNEYQFAMNAYQQASDCYLAEDQEVHSRQMLLKVAHYAALLKDYARAVELFEQVSQGSLEKISKWSCKEYLFNALICLLAMHAKANSINVVEDKLHEYNNMYPPLEGTREERFILASIEAVKSLNPRDFQDAINEYDQIQRFTEWQSGILLDVKDVIRHGTDGGDGDSVFE